MQTAVSPMAEKAIAGFLKSGRFAHAILLEGTNSDDVDAFTRRIATILLCRAPKGERPCGRCVSCKKVVADIHPDLLTYTGEGKSRAISLEKVREIRAQAYLLPNESEKKILLLKDTQTMLFPAQNALLKILEEPPPSAVFILTANNRFRLLETVRSRVSVISLESGQTTEHTPDNHEHQEAVRNLIKHLSRGEEALVLACLARYEKDRAAFLDMLNELRACLLRHMVSGRYKESGTPISPAKFWIFAGAVEQTLSAAEHNVGVPLLSCALCAGLFETNDESI